MSQFFIVSYKWARRCAIAFVGGTVVLVGVAMIVLPGPAIIVIPAGLAILSIEFACAKRWLHQARSAGGILLNKGRFWRRRKMPQVLPHKPATTLDTRTR